MNELASQEAPAPSRGDEITSKILAYVGSAAIGFTAAINMVIAGVVMFTGNLIGAIGDASSKLEGSEKVVADASHAALQAKLLAVGFALLAGLGFIAGAFLKRRKRHLFVPIAAAINIAGWVGFSAWTKNFSALDAIMIGCALFATFIWYRQPKTLPEQPSYSRW